MYNKINFKTTKFMKYFLSRRSSRHDVFSSITFISLLIFTFFIIRNIPVHTSASKSEETGNNTNSSQVTFVGDVMLGRYMQPVYEKLGIDKIFSHAKIDWSESDYVIANLENAVVSNIDKTKKYDINKQNINLAIDEETMINLSKDSNIDLYNLANNHMLDYGHTGALETLDILENNSIDYVGLYKNSLAPEDMFKTIKINDTSISIVSFSDVDPYHSKTGVRENSPGMIKTNSQQYQLLKTVINHAREKSDLVFIYTHWGEEYSYAPSKKQKEITNTLLDLDVDLIVGAHPHVLQPVEIINGVPIVYSLGNFVFDQGQGGTVSTVMMHVNIENKKIKDLEFLPYFIKNGIPEPENSKFNRKITFEKITKFIPTNKIEHNNYDDIRINLQNE